MAFRGEVPGQKRGGPEGVWVFFGGDINPTKHPGGAGRWVVWPLRFLLSFYKDGGKKKKKAGRPGGKKMGENGGWGFGGRKVFFWGFAGGFPGHQRLGFPPRQIFLGHLAWGKKKKNKIQKVDGEQKRFFENKLFFPGLFPKKKEGGAGQGGQLDPFFIVVHRGEEKNFLKTIIHIPRQTKEHFLMGGGPVDFNRGDRFTSVTQ